MPRETFIKSTTKVSNGLLNLILNGLICDRNLHLQPSDIVMMESSRKSSILPTGKDWREIAAEYTLKHLIFSDRTRKAFIAWILNAPNPLATTNIMHISKR